MERTQDRQWQARSPVELVWREWDGEYVAYHRPSGMTHYLNQPSHELLTSFLLVPRTALSVAEEIIPEQLEEDAEDAVGQMLALLYRFEFLGLVDRA